MIYSIARILHLLVVLAILTPTLGSAFEDNCASFESNSCHHMTGFSDCEDESTRHDSHCPAQHTCCNGAAYVMQNMTIVAGREQTIEFGVNFSFSFTSAVVEGPSQPPEA